MAWERPRIRRKTHNKGIRRTAVIFMLISVATMVLGMWALATPEYRMRGIAALVMATAYFGIGSGIFEKRTWAWPLAMLLIIAQLAVLPAITWPAWWYGGVAAVALLPFAGYLAQASVRKRFASENNEKRVPVSGATPH